MSKNLVIVESPAKAKTIEKFLGSDYVVKSSIGHIRDMPKKDMGVDIENNFQPTYAISADKKKVVADLKNQLRPQRKSFLRLMKIGRVKPLLGIYNKRYRSQKIRQG